MPGLSTFDDIDIRIAEISSREPSSENLNLLGDLLLKKGDKNKAIEYFYAAARKAYVQKKIIAIYKKILKISPSETDAFEGLADVYARGGYIGEEIKCLEALVQLYRQRGDAERARDTYKRMHDLDVESKVAKPYLSKAKGFPGEPSVDRTARSPYTGEEVSSEEGLNKVGQDQLEETRQKAPWEREAAYRETRKRTLWEAIGLGKTRDAHAQGWKKGILVSGIVLLLFVAATSGYLYLSKREKGPVTVTFKGEAFEVEVNRLSGEMLSQLLRADLSPDEIKGKSIYSVKVKALTGCIPDDFVKNLSGDVSFIGKKGENLAPVSLPSLGARTKLFYKYGVCEKPRGIVFAHFYLSHLATQNTVGIFVEELDKDRPITLRWN